MLPVFLSALTTVLIYSLVLLAGLWCWFQWSYRDVFHTARKLPTVYRSLPFLGHAHYFLRAYEDITGWMLDYLLIGLSQGLSTFCLWLGPLPLIFVQSPDDVQKVLNSSSTLEKSPEYQYLKPFLGNSLLRAPHDVWKVVRRHINPLFHPHNLEHLMPVFNRNSRELVSDLSEHVGRAPVNVFDYTMDISLKNVCQLIFGPSTKVDTGSKEFRGLRKVVEMLPELWGKRNVLLWLRVDAIFNFIYRKELQEQGVLWNQFTEGPLKKARSKLSQPAQEDGKISDNLVTTSHQPESKTFVELYSAMQRNYQSYTDEDLRHEIAAIYTTGTDTVSLLTASCLLILAHYQEVQKRLYQEITSVVGPDDDVTLQDLHRMSYLDQVYKETLRWASIVPLVARKTTEEITLSTCKIPAGNTVVVSLYGLNMNPKTFPNPKVFDPDRFAPNSSEGMEKSAFLPFSGGPRNCIGQRYSDMSMKIMVVHVLRKYKVSTKMNVHSLKKKFLVTLICSEGYNISLENRI